MCILYANTTPLYVRNLRICKFHFHGEFWNPSPRDSNEQPSLLPNKYTVN